MKLRYIVLLSFSVTGCSAAKFSTSKSDALSKAVFTNDTYNGQLDQPNAPGNGIENTGGSANGSINQPAGGGDGANGSINQPGSRLPSEEGDDGSANGMINQPDGSNDEVDFLLMCSDRRSEDASNFKHAVANNLPVQLVIGDKVCTDDPATIQSLITKKSFSIADAQKICPALVPASGKWANVSLVIDGVSSNSMRGTITVLYALNTDKTPANETADALCDRRSSPLVIHLRPSDLNAAPSPVALSSQADGIFFDLLGARYNHEAVRISWFTNSQYGVLVLPDANGQVHSIDQLFGNATVGPDGLFAENGYDALAKYDGTSADGMLHLAKADGLIDAQDPVFSRLRVWVDSNRDGIAQPRELIPLARAGIASIDLAYSNDYKETDKYGNQTLMKSVVKRIDGTFDLIFDVWFAYQFAGGL